jgi:hypothetical protein
MQMKRAWLVTWEWDGSHAAVEEDKRVVAIFNSRLSTDKVARWMELHYINEWGGLSERLAYAENKKNVAYQAEIPKIQGVQWSGEVICGDNPYLWARYVYNLRVETNANYEPNLFWEERVDEERKEAQQRIAKRWRNEK